MKKFLALCLSLAMVLALSVTAFAVDSYTITVDNTGNDSVTIVGKTYSAYKLFDVTYSGTTTENVDADAPHAYTIQASNYFYSTGATKAELDKYFMFTASADDPNTFVVTGKLVNDSEGRAPGAEGYVETHYEFTADDARTLADALATKLPSSADGTSPAATAETVTIDVTTAGPGYYLVYGTAKPTEDGTTETQEVTAAIALTTTDPAGKVRVKTSIPTNDKKITNSDVNENGTSKNVGDVVEFEVDSKVPDTTGYTKYVFTLHDKMSDGLTFNNTSVKVYINDTEIASTATFDHDGDTSTAEVPVWTMTETTTDECTFEVKFHEKYMLSQTAGQAVKFTYSATVNSTALTTDEEDNTSKIEYSNNPYDDNDTETTPPDKVYVYDFDIVIDKVNAAGEKLADAKFILYKEVEVPCVEGDDGYNADPKLNGKKTVKNYYVVDSESKVVTWTTNEADATEVTTDANGAASFTGLAAGTYMLHETEAPKGYNLLTADVPVTLTANLKEDGTDNGSTEEIEATVQLDALKEIENKSGIELPSTGGIGTTIFYVVGGLMVAVAGVMLITKKRMSREG